ncbi:hypothetical protein [uncultured Alistipes sp.]|uniref:hypothetical protein n=1 Tax=uncultured Alistipes sp. TaxID=538949 RepID=UPI0025DF0555|nr:hypothetical protein [uncultured Alistipes sp.]
MSKKITVKLRPENIENISVRSCRKGVYLTFDAGNIRSIVCKYSEVITICTPKPIYDDERIQLYDYDDERTPPILGPMLYSLLEKNRISAGLFHWDCGYPFARMGHRAIKNYVIGLYGMRNLAVINGMKAIIISLDDWTLPNFLLKKRKDENFYSEVMKMAKDLNLIVFVLWHMFPEKGCDWGDKLIRIKTPAECHKTETIYYLETMNGL